MGGLRRLVSRETPVGTDSVSARTLALSVSVMRRTDAAKVSPGSQDKSCQQVL